METKTKEKLAVFIPTDGNARIVDLANGEHGNELETLQFAVGGWVQAVSLAQDWEGLVVWVNEEGKLNGLPLNYVATQIWSESFAGYLMGANDFITGNAVITGETDEEGETMGLGREQADKLVNLINNLI